jgi:hypothetical protein
MPRKLALLVLTTALVAALDPTSAYAEDNGGGQQPASCSFGPTSVPSGGVVVLPPGYPLDPSGAPGLPQAPPTPATPPQAQVYLCSGGHWIRVAGLEVGLQIAADATEIEVPEGTAAMMTGTYQSAAPLVTFAASAGAAAPATASTWTWSARPDDGASVQQVGVTATDDAGRQVGTVFDLHVTNVAPSVATLTASLSTALVGQPVTFAGTATDPSAADTAAGFSWDVAGGVTQSFDTCGSHTVTATATDKDGGVSDAFTSAAVQVWEASFQAPLTAGARNVVKAGQVVPVKVSVGCHGATIAGLAPSIRLLTGDVDPETKSDDPALMVPASVSSADTAGVMRPAAGGYLYNLKVPKAAAGTKFTIRVSPVEGASAQVVLEVR